MDKVKQKVKKEYLIIDYVNKHIVRSDFYRGSNRPLTEKSPIICPFHSECNPSFYYYKLKNRYKCFGCDISGDVIDLHMRWSEKIGKPKTFPEAVYELYNELKRTND